MPLNHSFLDFEFKYCNKVVTVRYEIIKTVLIGILGFSILSFGAYLDNTYSNILSLDCLATLLYITSVLILLFFIFHIFILFYIVSNVYEPALSNPNYEANIITKDVDLNDKDNAKELDTKEDIVALVEEQPKKIYYVCSHCNNKVYNNLSRDYFNFGQSCPLCGNIMKEVNEETN